MAVDDPSQHEDGSSEDAKEFGVELTWPGSEQGGRLAPRTPGASTNEPKPADRSAFGAASPGPEAEPAPSEPEPNWVRETVAPYEEPPSRPGGSESRAGVQPVQHGRLLDASALSDQLPAVQAGLARFESLNASMSALAARVDALVAGTSDLRSTLADRLSDHADTIGRLVRSNGTDIEERQRAVDRTLSDLRHSLTDSGEGVRSVGSRIDELAADVAHLSRTVEETTDHQREVSGERDKLSRQVVEGLDAFGDRLLDRLDELDTALATEIGTSRAEVARLRTLLAGPDAKGNAEAIDARFAELRDDLSGLAKLMPDGNAIRDGVVEAVSLGRDRVDERFDQLVADVARLRADGAAPAMSKAVREELAALRTSLDELRESGTGNADLRAAIEEVHAEQGELSRAAEGLLELREAIELVPDSEVEAAPGLLDADGAPIDVAGEFEALRQTIAAQSVGASQGDVRALRTALGELREDVLAWVEDGAGAHDDGGTEALVALKGELSGIRKNTARLEAEVASMRADHAHDDQVLSEVAELRRMIEASGSNRGLSSLKKDIAALKETVEARPPVVRGGEGQALAGDATDQLESVRAELVALRRRMNLKAKPTSAALDEAQLANLAELVAERLTTLLELDIDSAR